MSGLVGPGGGAPEPLQPPSRLSEEQLLANGHNCNVAARASYTAGNAVAAAGFEIASALYHCTLHLAQVIAKPVEIVSPIEVMLPLDDSLEVTSEPNEG